MNSSILINNVEIFDGTNEATVRGNVLVKNGLIEKITQESVPVDPGGDTIVLDGKGRFLMPGLIDAHWHAYLCCNTMMGLLTEDVSFSHLTASDLSL